MSEEQTPQTPTVPQALGRLRVALNDSFNRASRDVGLTAQQAELLCQVLEPRSISELAERLHWDRSNVSHLVNRVSARDLVDRLPDDQDGRVSRVVVTDSGRTAAVTFLRRLEALTSDLRRDWSPERTATAAELLTEIAESLEVAADEA